MNYIKRLEAELAEAQASRADVAQQITGMLVYLQSPKFHADPTVQVAEVQRVLLDWRLALS